MIIKIEDRRKISTIIGSFYLFVLFCTVYAFLIEINFQIQILIVFILMTILITQQCINSRIIFERKKQEQSAWINTLTIQLAIDQMCEKYNNKEDLYVEWNLVNSDGIADIKRVQAHDRIDDEVKSAANTNDITINYLAPIVFTLLFLLFGYIIAFLIKKLIPGLASGFSTWF